MLLHVVLGAVAPQEDLLGFMFYKLPYIVHASGGDGEATLATLGIYGDVLTPAVDVNPFGTVNHQGAASC